MTIDELFGHSTDISKDLSTHFHIYDHEFSTYEHDYEYEKEIPFAVIKEISETINNYYQKFSEYLNDNQKKDIIEKCGFNEFEYNEFIKLYFTENIDFNNIFFKLYYSENIDIFKNDLKNILNEYPKHISKNQYHDYVDSKINGCNTFQLWLYYKIIVPYNDDLPFYKITKKPSYMIHGIKEDFFNYLLDIKNKVLNIRHVEIDEALSEFSSEMKRDILSKAEIYTSDEHLHSVIDQMSENSRIANTITVTDKRKLKSASDPPAENIFKFKEFVQNSIDNGYNEKVLGRYSLEKVLKLADKMSENIMLSITNEIKNKERSH